MTGAALLVMAFTMGTEPAREVEADNTFALAVGPSVDVDLVAGAFSDGGEASIEMEAVPHWLEVELGVEAVGGKGGAQVALDFLLKKPFTLAPRLEIMPGLGPLLTRSFGTNASTSFGVEVAADLMWWLFSPHAGLGFEPSGGVTFLSGIQTSVGLTCGPIFGW